MNFSINKNDKSNPIRKTLKQLYQESKNKPFTKKLKRGFAIFGAVVVSIIGISYASATIDQSNLERDNVQIVISDIDDDISVDYPTNSRKIKAKLSGISQLAKAKIADNSVNMNEYKDHSGIIEYEIKNIAEGENTLELSVQDGKRETSKTIKIKRQTKADYDKQELEKATAAAEGSIKKAESDPTDENIARAESAIKALPSDKQINYNKRLDVVKNTKQHATAPATVLATGVYRVLNVIDGDTIDISYNGKSERVRMIGLDTPETKDPRKPVQCFGHEASQRMRDLVAGKNVRIEQDATQGERDKYGRLLLYIYLEDGTNVAYKMIADGYGHEYTYKIPYKYQTQFKAAQKDAENNKRGLWANNTCAGDTKKSIAQQSAPPAQKQPVPATPQSPTPSSPTRCPKNCKEARAMGMTNMHTSHPCYRPSLDRDNDGIACDK